MEALQDDSPHPTIASSESVQAEVPDTGDEYAAKITVQTLVRRLATWRIRSTECDWLDIAAPGDELISAGRPYFAPANSFSVSTLSTAGEVCDLPSPPLSYPEHACDVLSVTGVLSRLNTEARIQFLREIRHLLRPHGILAVFEESPFHPRQWPAYLSGRRQTPTPNAIKSCLAAAGIEFRSRWYFLLNPAALRLLGSTWEQRLMHYPWGRRYAVFGLKCQ